MSREGILPDRLARTLLKSAKLRTILVHEYDFEEDYQKFYESAKKFLPAYHEYLDAIQKYISKE
ncbi:MAG: HepT-like ribonuclease domain-containing protein [Candidatus Sungiibacteriota bacterium]